MENIRTKWDFDNPLSDLSPKDNSWDAHRLDTQKVQNFYVQDTEFQKYAERLGGCSTLLKFAPVITDDKAGLKLKYAFFAVSVIALCVNGVGLCYGVPECLVFCRKF